MTEGVTRLDVQRVDDSGACATSDDLAVEAPLEIRVSSDGDGIPRTIAVTMRTPGHDAELAIGYLFTEGIVRRLDEVVGVHACRSGALRVELAPTVALDLAQLERHSYTSSSCGACGKTSTGALRATPSWVIPAGEPIVDCALMRALPGRLRDAQVLFATTGGLHASALFDLDGRLIVLREDVGRHNALDKVIGGELLAGRLPAHERILIVSGRVSFELVQKALMAGIPVVAAIGAPSSLAVELARESGITLIGFVRAGGFNLYSCPDRVRSVYTDQRGRRQGRP
jgi:FdhD protein